MIAIASQNQLFSPRVPPTGSNPCVAPQAAVLVGLAPVLDTSASFAIAWNPPPTPTGTILYWGTTNGGPYPNSQTFFGVSPYVVTGLTPNTTYYFIAAAFTSGPSCVGPASNQVTATTTLSAPFGIDISDASVDGDTVVIWSNPVPNATTNEVWKSTDGTNFSMVASGPGSSTEFHDLNPMVDGDVWYYKIRASAGAVHSAFTEVRAVSKNVDLSGSGAASISYSTLVIAYGSFFFIGCAALTSASFPLLRRVWADFDCQACGLLSSLTVPVLKTVGGLVHTFDCAFTSLSFPALQTLTGEFFFRGNAGLTTVSIPMLSYGVGVIFSFDGTDCFLSSATINSILGRLVINVPHPAGIANFSGVNNAAPTGQGLTDKGTLNSTGSIITTN